MLADGGADAGARGPGPARPGGARPGLGRRRRQRRRRTCSTPSRRRSRALAAGLATGERALDDDRAARSRPSSSPTSTPASRSMNAVAAEHVSLQCAGADALRRRRFATPAPIFIGPWSPIAAGDYATGTNHILPTGGAARAWSGVGVESFGRWIEVQRLTPAGVRRRVGDGRGDRRGRGPARARRQRSSRAPSAPGSGRAPTTRSSSSAGPMPVAAYPAEPSDEELAARAGIAVSAVVRADMNTLGGGPLPAVARRARRLRRPSRGRVRRPRLRAAAARRSATRLGVDAEPDRARRRAPTS